MKIANIQAGGGYVAKVGGVITTVRVLGLRETGTFRGATRTVIDVVNERTGRRVTFRSAARLRRPIPVESSR